MGALLQVVGIFWAVIGAFNLFGRDWSNEAMATAHGFAIIINMILFVIPGLLLAGVGNRIAKKKTTAGASGKGTPAERIAKLDGLLADGHVTKDEYDERRHQILNEI